jgi:hypothetical protein
VDYELLIHCLTSLNHFYRMKKILLLPISLWLLVCPSDVQSQMVSVVNSAADDEFAHVYDFQATPDFDESTDGICEDSMHRCTLRAALEEASILGTSARVTFSINDVIAINSAPGSSFNVPDGSFIQGFQQNVGIVGNFSNSVIFGVGNNTLISGLTITNGLIGILVGGNHNRIGLDNPDAANFITGMSQNGILIAGDSNEITGNVIGLDILGNPESNPFGVFITGRHNTIGGTHPGEGNIISGNDKGIGVYTIEDTTFIFGNKIGTSLNGTQSKPNRVGIDNIGPNLIIGNGNPDGKNVISGNTESGILFGVNASHCYVLENNIGTDISGTLSIPNRDGITLGPGTDTCTVGNNLIKHNSQNGILVSGINIAPELITRFNLIRGNTIQENGNAGIAITGEATDNVIGSSLNQTFDPNEISYNGQAGVVLVPGNGSPERNTIRENIFLDNTSYGIRIIGGQGGIQPPVFESYTDNGSTAIVLGTHNLVGAIIDLYAGDVNQANRLEGIEWIGSGPVDANGQFSIQISSCICDSIVATATDAIGNTSQFSDGLGTITAIQDPSELTFSTTAYPNPFNEKTTIEYKLDKADDISLNIHDLTGRMIENLFQGHLQQGIYQTGWNAGKNPSGFYYYQLNVGNQVHNGRLVLIK